MFDLAQFIKENSLEWMGLKPTQAISKKQSNRNYTQHAKRTK